MAQKVIWHPNMAPSFLLFHVITNQKSLKFTQIGRLLSASRASPHKHVPTTLVGIPVDIYTLGSATGLVHCCGLMHRRQGLQLDWCTVVDWCIGGRVCNWTGALLCTDAWEAGSATGLVHCCGLMHRRQGLQLDWCTVVDWNLSLRNIAIDENISTNAGCNIWSCQVADLVMSGCRSCY